jgi:hypothetical protein
MAETGVVMLILLLNIKNTRSTRRDASKRGKGPLPWSRDERPVRSMIQALRIGRPLERLLERDMAKLRKEYLQHRKLMRAALATAAGGPRRRVDLAPGLLSASAGAA